MPQYRPSVPTLTADQITEANGAELAARLGGTANDDGSITVPRDGGDTITLPLGFYVWKDDAYGLSFNTAEDFEAAWTEVPDGPTLRDRMAANELAIAVAQTDVETAKRDAASALRVLRAAGLLR